MSLQKFLKGKSDAYNWLICIVHAARALSSPSRCFQLSTNLDKISFVIFCAEMLQQISRMQKRLLTSCVFLQHKHSEVLH